MKTPTANFTTEKNKVTGAAPRTLLEIDADSGTLYYSDQAVTVDAQPYTAKVMSWGTLQSQLVPGEEVIRTGGLALELLNNPRINDSIRAGLEVRLYLWFTGLATADKLLQFRGIINEDIDGDIYKISFTCMDIGEWWNRKLGTVLLRSDYSGADPDDVGKIIPWGYGPFYNQPCLAIDAGWVSTLAQDYAAGGGTLYSTEATNAPSSGTFILGDETGTYTGKSGNNLTGVTGITKNYTRGDRVMENKSSVKFIVRDHITKSLSNARLLPDGKKLTDAVTIPSGSVTYNTNDSGVSTITLTELATIRNQVTLYSSVGDSGHQHLGTGTPGSTERRANGYSVASGSVSNPSNAYDLSKGDTTTYAQVNTGSQIWFNLDNSSPPSGTITKVTLKFYAASSVAGCGIYAGGQPFSFDPYINWKTIVVPITTWNASDMRVRFDTGAYSVIQVYDIYAIVEYTTAALTSVNATAISVTLAGNSVADTLGGILICDGEGYPDSEDIVVGTDTNDYKCILQHIASADTKPITGGSYTTYWSATGGSGSGNTWVSGKNYAEDGHYTGVTDALITEPWDVVHHLLENRSNGITHSDIDLSGSFADAESNLPASYDWAFVCAQDGLYLNKLLAMLAPQTFCRFVYEAGLAKLLRIKTSGTADKAVNINDGATSPLRDKRLQVSFKNPDLAQIWNNIEIKYNLDLTLGDWDIKEAYSGSSKDSDSTSITNYLTRDRTWSMFAVGDNDTMADDLRDKLLDYWANPKPPYLLPAILTQIELERGDLIELTCSQLGYSGNLCEVLETDYSPPMPRDRQAPQFWLKVLYLLISNLRLTDTAQAGDALTKIDVDAVLTDTAQAGDALTKIDVDAVLTDTAQAGDEVAIDVTIPQLTDGAQIGDTLTLIKSLWFFDGTRYYDSTKYFNSAP